MEDAWSTNGQYYIEFYNFLNLDISCFTIPNFFIYSEREFGYGATRSTDDSCVTDRFFVFKV
jgi:hypothetical protein